jgi:hypothetical protein
MGQPSPLVSSTLAAVIVLACVSPVSAKECIGVSFPDQVEASGSALTLNGLGLRKATMLKVKVYVAGLYVSSAATTADAILAADTSRRLVLHFVRDVGAADLRSAWQEGFEKNVGNLDALAARIEKLKGWTTDIKNGQELAFTHTPGTGIEVNVNGETKGTIEGDDFVQPFFSIWLGAHPPNPELKTGLLGGPCT